MNLVDLQEPSEDLLCYGPDSELPITTPDRTHPLYLIEPNYVILTRSTLVTFYSDLSIYFQSSTCGPGGTILEP